MEQDVMKKVMDEVMKRLGTEETKASAPAAAPAPSCEPEASFAVPNIGVTEFVGVARGHTIGLVVANIESTLHEKLGIDPKYKSVGILSDRIGAGPQIMAADEAVKATNTEIVKLELCRDTEGGAGHGCFILFGAEDVSDARRAVEVALKDLDRTFGDVHGNDVGYLEFQYTARASYAINKAFGAPIGKAFGLILAAPAGVGFVICDTALKAAEVELLSISTPSEGTCMTNEFIIAVCGDSGAVRQSVIAAREMGKKLLSAFGEEPKSMTVPYI